MEKSLDLTKIKIVKDSIFTIKFCEFPSLQAFIKYKFDQSEINKMTSTNDEILNTILKESDDSKIPQDILSIIEELDMFVTSNFLTHPVSYQQSLKIYYPSSEKVSSQICNFVRTLCKHLNLPDSVYKDYEYAFNTLITDIVKINTKLTSTVLSNSQNNSPDSKIIKGPSLFNSRNLPNSKDDTEEENDDQSLVKNEIKELKLKIEYLQNQLKDDGSNDEIVREFKDRSNLLSNYNNDIRELEAIIDKKDHQNDNLRDEILNLTKQIKLKEEHVASIEERLKEADDINDQMKVSVQNLNDKILKKSKKISQLKTQVSTLQLKLNSFPSTEEKSDNAKEIKYQNMIKILTDANIEREKESEKKSQILEKTLDIIKKQQSLIDEYNYRLSMCNEDIDHFKKIIQNQSSENKRVKELLTKKESESADLISKLTDIQRQTNSPSKANSLSSISDRSLFDSEDEVNNGTIEAMKSEVNRLRGSVDILCTFIQDVLTKEDRTTIPLLQSTAPIFSADDEVLIKATIDQIEQMKLTFKSYKRTQEIDFFFQVFRDTEKGYSMVKDYIESGRDDLYAFFVALCSVDKRLISFIHYQDTILESLNEYVPEEYENTEESLISFVADSKRAYDYLMQIYDIAYGEGSAKKSQQRRSNMSIGPFAPIFELLRQFKGMVSMIETTFRVEPFNFKETLNELPLFLQDYFVETSSQVQELQQMNMDKTETIQELKQQQVESSNLVSEVEYEKLNAQIRRLSEQIESQTQKILSQKVTIDTDQKTIERLNNQIEKLGGDQKRTELELNSFRAECEKLSKQNERLFGEIDNYKSTLDAKNKIYQNRLNVNIQSIQSKCDDEINRMKRRHEEQMSLLNNTLQERAAKIQNLKESIKRMKEAFEETTFDQKTEIIKMTQYIEQSDIKNHELETKLAALKKSQKIASRQPVSLSSFSPLSSVISFPVSPKGGALSPNRDENETERTEVNIMSTPVASRSIELSPEKPNMSSITLSAINEKNDRFASQVGRILSKYFNAVSPPTLSVFDSPPDSGCSWTRTKVIKSVTFLVDKAIALEEKVNNSILIDVSPVKTPGSGKVIPNEDRKREIAEAIRQEVAWRNWASETAAIIGGNQNVTNGDATETYRKIIRDFVVSTSSKCKLVFKLQLLRNQKRILIRNNGLVGHYLPLKGFEKDQSDPFMTVGHLKSLVLVINLCSRLRKYAKTPLSPSKSSKINSAFITPTKVRMNRLAVDPK